MNSLPLISRVMAVFLLIVIGYTARKAKVLDKNLVRGISGFILNVAIPFTVIAGFDRSIPKTALPDLLSTGLWAIILHSVAIVLSTLAYRKLPDVERKVISYGTVFSNCGFMGFPVVASTYGKIGVMYASIYVVVFQTFIWTYGVALFSGGKAWAKLAKALINPGIISVAIGAVLWFLPFDLPVFMSDAIGFMSDLTTPLSMVVVGASLAEVPLKGLAEGWELWLGTAARIVLMPLISLGIIKILGINDLPAKVAVFLTAMPVAAQSVMFAERYEADVGLASRLVFVTTVLSALTIPLFALALG